MKGNTAIPFRIGDLVHLRGVGTGVVRALRRGRATVAIKGRTLVVDVALLNGAEPEKGKRGRREGRSEVAQEPPVSEHQRPSAARERVGESEGRSPSDKLDLHGHTVEEAIAALDAFINDALLASASEVRVIHGRSGGRVKQAVHARLRELSVRSVRLDPRNPGVTIVTF